MHHERQNEVSVGVARSRVSGEHVARRSVESFHQAISLRMVGSGCAMDNVTFSEEFVQDFRKEHTSSVAEKFSRCTVMNELSRGRTQHHRLRWLVEWSFPHTESSG